MQSRPSGCRPACSFMNTQPDFEDFLRMLEVHRVDSMIVGDYAVVYHVSRDSRRTSTFSFPTPAITSFGSKRHCWTSASSQPSV
jgi:hypothetical protein